MSDYRRDPIKLLEAAGCRCIRAATKNYELWESPANDRRFPVKHKIKSRHSANGILKQAGLPKAF